MKNHAFLFIVHKQPELFGRIVRLLAQTNHYFFIHVDSKSGDLAPFENAVQGVDNMMFMKKRIDVQHAGVSQIWVHRTLLEEAYRHPSKMNYFHVLSGQDYPLRSNAQFDHFFEATDDSFMYLDSGAFRLQMESHYHRCTDEYHFNHTSTLWSRLYEKLQLGRIFRLLVRRPPIENLCGGWDWYSWSRQTTTFVLKYLQDHPSYLQRFNHTCAGIEMIFATLLSPRAAELHIQTENPLRYVSWHPKHPVEGSYRPYDLTSLDYDYIVDSKAFFCRKVDEVKSRRLLDQIDRQREAHYDISEHYDFV